MRPETFRSATWASLTAGALAFAAALPAWGAATASASTKMELSGCAASSVVATPSGSSTSQAAIASSSVGGCSMRGSGFSYLGVVGASARAELTGGFGASGAIFAKAGGSWSDSLQPDLAENLIPVVADLAKIRLNYNLGATGGVSASAQPTDGGFLANGAAAIGYEFNLGGHVFQGRQTVNAFDGKGVIVEGQWGTIAGAIDLDVLVDLGGNLIFNPVSLSMSGTADASVGNFFAGGFRSAHGEGNFGSTLIWGGVASFVGIDKAGNEVPLPEDFRMSLIGRDGGLDYWDAAVRPPVPEPGTAALAAAGLGILDLALRRRRPV